MSILVYNCTERKTDQRPRSQTLDPLALGLGDRWVSAQEQLLCNDKGQSSDLRAHYVAQRLTNICNSSTKRSDHPLLASACTQESTQICPQGHRHTHQSNKSSNISGSKKQLNLFHRCDLEYSTFKGKCSHKIQKLKNRKRVFPASAGGLHISTLS